MDNGKVYSCGDATAGQTGRRTKLRTQDQEEAEKLVWSIEQVNAKQIVDIFCGNYHNFLVNKKGQVYSFGMNNFGQLGIGFYSEFEVVPREVKTLDGMKVK